MSKPITRKQAIQVLKDRQEWLSQKIAAHPDNFRANCYFREEVEALGLAILALERERELMMRADTTNFKKAMELDANT
jgi:hypothetical protein